MGVIIAFWIVVYSLTWLYICLLNTVPNKKLTPINKEDLVCIDFSGIISELKSGKF